ncbi:fimbrillin family protein [Leyella stercorea]|uniref:fimbrillin family protein n=1 Tax=Leyella stercorea TaxID=363265 RepID=UPI00266BDBBB|nr:fimbrillin family protein [Leyella stercorea]
MKKILYSVFMLATMVLAACSSDDTTEPAVKRGMVLKANVEDTDTRATIDTVGGTWRFAFAMGDMVKVGNNQVEGYYTFKNNGTEFSSADALQTTKDATWYAYFPDETISLVNQSGDLADVANRYALAGATATPTTGSNGLTVTMKAKAAVLCIVGVNKDEKLDISVKTADDGKYVSGFKAVKNSEGFSVETSDTKVSLLSKQGAGVYYVVVPAGVKISVSNGDKSLYSGDKPMSTTKADGLKAGKYYTLTTGMTKGSAKNSLGEDIDWVQLWPGGPKFATQNVAEAMTWTDAVKTGDDFAWGKNWRTPTIDEVYGEGKLYCKLDKDNFPLSVAGSPSFELKKEGEYLTVVLTGVQPGYTKNTLTLYNQKTPYSHNFDFWTTSEITGYGIRFAISAYELNNEVKIVAFGPSQRDNKNTKYLVRPVLVE